MIDSIIDGIVDIGGKYFASKEAKEEFKRELQGHPHIERMAQIGVNREEAKHASVWVAGWRPFVGWICGLCLAWIVIGRDLMIAFTDISAEQLPTGNTDIVLWVLGIILGANIGGRTFEKVKGVARGAMK